MLDWGSGEIRCGRVMITMIGWVGGQTDEYVTSTPPSYCYKHEPRQTGRGGGVATIYSDILNVTQKTGYRFGSFEILMLNVKLSDKQNKSVLSLALATVYRPPGPFFMGFYWPNNLFWCQAKCHRAHASF